MRERNGEINSIVHNCFEYLDKKMNFLLKNVDKEKNRQGLNLGLVH